MRRCALKREAGRRDLILRIPETEYGTVEPGPTALLQAQPVCYVYGDGNGVL
jgi:hypothetical protein